MRRANLLTWPVRAYHPDPINARDRRHITRPRERPYLDAYTLLGEAGRERAARGLGRGWMLLGQHRQRAVLAGTPATAEEAPILAAVLTVAAPRLAAVTAVIATAAASRLMPRAPFAVSARPDVGPQVMSTLTPTSRSNKTARM